MRRKLPVKVAELRTVVLDRRGIDAGLCIGPLRVTWRPIPPSRRRRPSLCDPPAG